MQSFNILVVWAWDRVLLHIMRLLTLFVLSFYTCIAIYISIVNELREIGLTSLWWLPWIIQNGGLLQLVIWSSLGCYFCVIIDKPSHLLFIENIARIESFRSWVISIRSPLSYSAAGDLFSTQFAMSSLTALGMRVHSTPYKNSLSGCCVCL